jgi:hypothetical protein
MKNLEFITFLLMIGFILSCYKKVVPKDINEVKLRVQPNKNITTDSIIVSVILENYTGRDIFILDRKTISFSDNPVAEWNVKILFKDGTSYISNVGYFINPPIPQSDEYYKVRNKESYSFEIIVIFDKLVKSPSEFSQINSDYGEYSIQLIYKDAFVKHKNALIGEIESNKIKISYKSS